MPFSTARIRSRLGRALLPPARGLMALWLVWADPGLAQETPPPASQPLWEVGVGGFAAVTPNYPASGNYAVNGFPVPLTVYRGRIVRLGDEAVARLVPLDTPRAELGISVDAAFGVDSDDNDLREGLPDLSPLIEIGPEIVFKGTSLGASQVELALQGRAAYSVDFDNGVVYRGLVAEPQIRVIRPGLIGAGSVARVALGSIFASRRLHEYFYDVPAAFARPGRPAFDAEAGYLGTELTLGLGVPVAEKLDLFVGAELGLYAGAANADSPLFEDDVTGSVFVGIAYRLFRSRRTVPARR